MKASVPEILEYISTHTTHLFYIEFENCYLTISYWEHAEVWSVGREPKPHSRGLSKNYKTMNEVMEIIAKEGLIVSARYQYAI